VGRMHIPPTTTGYLFSDFIMKRTRVIALMQLRMVARVALELQTFSYFERRLSSGSQLGEKLQ